MPTSPKPTEQLPRIDVRVRISALWTATMLIFAYVDLFSLYRADVREGLDNGMLAFFEVGEPLLIGVTLYVIVPALMIYLALVLPRGASRIVNIAVAAVYAVTIAVSAIGEWSYFVLGSVVELALLALVIRLAWAWRPIASDASRHLVVQDILAPTPPDPHDVAH